MSDRGLKQLSIATLLVLAAGVALAVFRAPIDEFGFVQKIFYIHVPLAIVALAGFIAAGIEGYRHLMTDDPRHDANSYVFIHISVVYGAATLITGMIWAKAAWGHYWVWDEPSLVSFLIVFLLYATYYPFRYAIEDRDRQARYASIFAITAGLFVPLNFMAVRMAENLVHPRVFATAEGGLPGSMLFPFLVCLAGLALLYVTLVKLELLGKRTAGRVARLSAEARAAGDGDDAPRAGVSTGSRIAPKMESR
ncbi:MAG: cytochrome c biogenesis protein [Solirubrobacterales bacterium]|nr:cytochrome c biogenesis protein [Solirubrobacterales bacterium]